MLSVFYFAFPSYLYGQGLSDPLNFLSAFPKDVIRHEFKSISSENFSLFTGLRPVLLNRDSFYNITINNQIAINNGHPNIDNNAEFYALKGVNHFTSMKYNYSNKWLYIAIEPYITKQSKDAPDPKIDIGTTYNYLNNQYYPKKADRMKAGFRQSSVILHYKGFGIGYSNESQWWGTGLSSSIIMSNNAPGVETYSIGTFKEIKYKKYGFGLRAIVSPFDGFYDDILYFSGLAASFTYYSEPTVTLGFYRSYLSANFDDLQGFTSLERDWTMEDALKLVTEPLFGKSKKNLDYTFPGSPGFDIWDEILTAYINITFPKDYLKIYLELSSDDNRANIIDLASHWDHTLGYLLGFRKYYHIGKIDYLFGSEYLSMKMSNTKKFWRTYYHNYYAKAHYNYFTNDGRRMGAHSGSSSDDLVLFFGVNTLNKSILFSFNIERHGIVSKTFPEKKREININYTYKFNEHFNVFVEAEFEWIQNYNFEKENFSKSNLGWLGINYYLK